MWTQALFVTRMNLRGLNQRVGASSMIVMGMAAVVAVLIALLAMAMGFSKALGRHGRADRVVVVGSGATAELVSGLSRAAVATMIDGPDIRQHAGERLASAETLMLVNVATRAGGATSAVLRGMGPRGFDVRPEVRIVGGRTFQPAVRELIVGVGAQRLYSGLNIGDRIVLRGAEWTVVGHFHSGGGIHDSELIGDVDTLMSAYRREVFQSVTAVLASGATRDSLVATLKAQPNLRMEVHNERDFYQRQARSVDQLLSFVVFVVGTFMAIGALFAALNTMYAAVAARAAEIGTLRALGFAPAAVVLSVFCEAILLALAGALIGAALSGLLFGGKTISSMGSDFGGQIAFDIDISFAVIGMALQMALVVAIAGALFPALRAARMPIVDALRQE